LPNFDHDRTSDAMDWHVQYRQAATDHVGWHPSPERAIEAACRLIDAGHDVFGIGTGPFTDSIGQVEIARIYDIWARAKPTARRFGPPAPGHLRP
jgi:hypothetical protein